MSKYFLQIIKGRDCYVNILKPFCGVIMNMSRVDAPRKAHPDRDVYTYPILHRQELLPVQRKFACD